MRPESPFPDAQEDAPLTIAELEEQAQHARCATGALLELLRRSLAQCTDPMARRRITNETHNFICDALRDFTKI
jgi:hypothetical protein